VVVSVNSGVLDKLEMCGFFFPVLQRVKLVSCSDIQITRPIFGLC